MAPSPLFAFLLLLATGVVATSPYYGAKIGKFTTNFHDVRGDVFAVDDKTIFIKNFTYDGKGPDTFFWAGTSIRPDASGFIIPNEKGSIEPLPAYKDQDVLLRLPAGKRVQDLRWLAVWCRRFTANFGSLIFPRGLKTPERLEIGRLSATSHGVTSGPILVLDSQTFFVPDFSYDGNDTGAYWWVSRGLQPNAAGLRLADENGRDGPLRQYFGEAVVIALPEDHSIHGYNWFGVWSEDKKQSLGHVRIPEEVLVPPSSRMLGTIPESQLNCEVLHNDLGFELRWVMDGDGVVMQLVGKVGDGEYMAFGWSKDDTTTEMVNADAVAVWIDKDGEGHAVDYFLGAKQQCSGVEGSCPDTAHEGGDNDVTLMNAATVNGYKMVSFKRPLVAADSKLDQRIYSAGHQAVMWAIGPLNPSGEVGYHHLRTKGNLLIEFGRTPRWNCPAPDEELAESVDHETSASEPIIAQSAIICPSDQTFRAQLGPSTSQEDTGSEQVSWYMNGLPRPDLTVARGKTYTFLVEGGKEEGESHPLYLTDSESGGNPDKESVYAGASPGENGHLVPTAAGRLCEWITYVPNSDLPDTLSPATSHQQTLELRCEAGDAAVLEWTPTQDTPDVLYYQSFTSPGLGGRIYVVNSCEETAPRPYLETLSTPELPEIEEPLEEELVDDLEQQPAGGGGEREVEGDGPQEESSQSIQERVAISNSSALEVDSDHEVHPPVWVEDVPETLGRVPFEPVSDPRPPPRTPPGTQYTILSQPPHLQQGDVQYERGFLPLVVQGSNSYQNRIPDPTPPPPGPLRPFPFDANQSIPFHGTFKPGKLDFSGFNVSHYGPTTHAPQYLLRLPSAPRPQFIQQPLSPPPPRMFARPLPYGVVPRPLPPHVTREIFVPQADESYVFVQRPPGGYPLPRPLEEDLEVQSSQNSYVAVQSPDRPAHKPPPPRMSANPPTQGFRRPGIGNFIQQTQESFPQPLPQRRPHPQREEPLNQALLREGPRPPLGMPAGDAPRPLPYGARLRLPVQGPNSRFAPQPPPPPRVLVVGDSRPPAVFLRPIVTGGRPLPPGVRPARPVREPLMDPEREEDEVEEDNGADISKAGRSPPAPQQVIFPHQPPTDGSSGDLRLPPTDGGEKSEQLVLPQADTKAPPTDNNTDYSIFSHIFSLITEDHTVSNIAVPRAFA